MMNWHSIRPSALVAAPLLLGIGAFSPPAHAAGGTISACPTKVNAPGVWKVTGNLTATAECITIAANGAAIDLGGYTITGLNKGGPTWGVGEEGAGRFSSIIIANGTIKNFEYGVLLETTTNATIAKINATGNSSGIVAFTPVVITQITFNIGTGGDDLRGDSSATASVILPGGTQTFTLKAQSDPGWGNNSDHVKTFNIAGPPQPLSAFGPTTITLTSHNSFTETDDNWNIQSVAVTVDGPSGSAVVFNQSGNPLSRLTGSAPSVTLQPVAGA
jgi:hypothetical protein